MTDSRFWYFLIDLLQRASFRNPVESPLQLTGIICLIVQIKIASFEIFLPLSFPNVANGWSEADKKHTKYFHIIYLNIHSSLNPYKKCCEQLNKIQNPSSGEPFKSFDHLSKLWRYLDDLIRNWQKPMIMN